MEPIEDAYFNWLYFKVASVDVSTPSLSYYRLLRELHSKEFVWLISGDDNRAEDGIVLRKEFLTYSKYDYNSSWVDLPCSVLEMLIAFCRRAEFDTDFTEREWFWMLLDNLELSELNDTRLGISEITDSVLTTLIWRTYDYDGNGGLFPTENSINDQRKVEIFYQWCNWVYENDLL
jgi:hypothetical protein